MGARASLVLACSIVACSSTAPNTTHPSTGNGGGGATSSSSAGQTSLGGSLATTGGGGSSPVSSNGGSGGTLDATGGTIGVAGSVTVGGGGSGGSAPSGAGSGNFVPATYTGMPFKALTIPGIIYAADYDKGGAGIGYCRVGAANPPSPATCMTAKLDDWCCSPKKGCDERTQPTVCPTYRADDDNAGLSHLNTGEPDNYAATSATWVDGPNGPTLTGPMVTAGSAVPSDMSTTTVADTYISYMYTGQWEQYTVDVAAAGTYSIGGVFASPGATITLDFGNSVTTGPIMVPVSPVADCKCPETYHSWNIVSSIGTITFPAAGTYLMRFTLTAEQFNPLYFTFTKM